MTFSSASFHTVLCGASVYGGSCFSDQESPGSGPHLDGERIKNLTKMPILLTLPLVGGGTLSNHNDMGHRTPLEAGSG